MIDSIDIPEQEYFNKIKINVEDIDESDNPNTITIQIPENPTLNQQNVLENIDVETSNLITYNQNDFDYGTTINIDLSKYRNYNIINQSNQWRTITTNNVQLTLADLFINYNPTANQLFSPNNTLTIQIPETMSIPKLTLYNIRTHNYYSSSSAYFTVLNKKVYKTTQNDSSLTLQATPYYAAGNNGGVIIALVFTKIFTNNYIIDFVAAYHTSDSSITRTLTNLPKGSYIIQSITNTTIPITDTTNEFYKTISIEDLNDSSEFVVFNEDSNNAKSSDITIYADLSDLDDYVTN